MYTIAKTYSVKSLKLVTVVKWDGYVVQHSQLTQCSETESGLVVNTVKHSQSEEKLK